MNRGNFAIEHQREVESYPYGTRDLPHLSEDLTHDTRMPYGTKFLRVMPEIAHPYGSGIGRCEEEMADDRNCCGLYGRGFEDFSRDDLRDIILHKNKVIADLEEHAYDKVGGIDFSKLDWGSFTKQARAHGYNKNRLEDFADYVIANKDKFEAKTEKRAHFYKNVILKGGMNPDETRKKIEELKKSSEESKKRAAELAKKEKETEEEMRLLQQQREIDRLKGEDAEITARRQELARQAQLAKIEYQKRVGDILEKEKTPPSSPRPRPRGQGAAPTPKAEPKAPSGVAAAAEALKPVREAIQNGIGDALYGKEDDPRKQKKGLLGISEEGKEESKKKVMKNIVVPIVKAANQLKTNIEDTANMIFNKDKYDADMKERRIKYNKKVEAEKGIVRDKENPSIIIRKPRGYWTAETSDLSEEPYSQKRLAVWPRRDPFGVGEVSTKDVFYVRVPNPIFAAKLKPSMKEFAQAGIKLWTGVQQIDPNKSEDVDGTLKQLQDDAFIWIPEDSAKEIYGKLRQFVSDKQDEQIAPEFADEGWTKGQLRQFLKIDPRTLKGQDLIDWKESKLAFDKAQTQNALDKVNKDIADEEAKTGYVVINNMPVKREPDQARLAKMREAKQRVLKRQQDLFERGRQEFKDMMMFSNAEKAKRDAEYYARQKADAQGTIDQADADKAEFDAKPIAERIAILESYKAEMGDDPAIDEQIEQLRAEAASDAVKEQAQGSVDLLQQPQEVGGAKPKNPALYAKAKAIADKTYSKPSAYKSGFIVKKYKEMGGEYEDEPDRKRPLERWFKEEWKDIGNEEYPVYRPTKRVSKETPLTPEEIDPENLKLQIREKQRIKGDRNLSAFQKRGGRVWPSRVRLGIEEEEEPEEPEREITEEDIILNDARMLLEDTPENRRTMRYSPDGSPIAHTEGIIRRIRDYYSREDLDDTQRAAALAPLIGEVADWWHLLYGEPAFDIDEIEIEEQPPMEGEGDDEDDEDDEGGDDEVEEVEAIEVDMGGNVVYMVDVATGKYPDKTYKQAISSIFFRNRRVFDAETGEEVGLLGDPLYKRVAMKVLKMEREERKMAKRREKGLLYFPNFNSPESAANQSEDDDAGIDVELVGEGAVEWTLQKAGKSLFNPSGDKSKAGRQSFTPDWMAYGGITDEEGRKNAFDLARSMYNQSKAIELPDFKLVRDDTSLRFYQHLHESVILVGIRGTDVKSWTDLYTWAVIGANQDLRMTKRFQDDLAKLVSFQRSYPPSNFYYVATGSSLAGSIADRFLEMGLIEEAITYNPSIEKKYILDENILNHRIYLDTDPLFILMGQYAPNTEIRVNPNKTNFYNPSKEKDYLIASHSIYPIYNPAFEGGGMEGSGKTYTLEEWKAIFDAKLEEKRLAIEAREAKKKQTAKAKRERAKARRDARDEPPSLETPFRTFRVMKATPPKEPEPEPEEEEEYPEVAVTEYEIEGVIYLVEDDDGETDFSDRRVFDDDSEELGALGSKSLHDILPKNHGKKLVDAVMKQEKRGKYAVAEKFSSESLPFFESRQPKAPKAPASARVELREALVAEQPRAPSGEFAKPAEVAVVAVSQAPQRAYMKLMKSPSLTDADKRLMMRIRETGMTPTMKTRLLARSGLARKVMELLGVNTRSSFQSSRDVKRIADTIEKRVEGRKVREILLPEEFSSLFEKRKVAVIQGIRNYREKEKGITDKNIKYVENILKNNIEGLEKWGLGGLEVVAYALGVDPFAHYYGDNPNGGRLFFQNTPSAAHNKAHQLKFEMEMRKADDETSVCWGVLNEKTLVFNSIMDWRVEVTTECMRLLPPLGLEFRQSVNRAAMRKHTVDWHFWMTGKDSVKRWTEAETKKWEEKAEKEILPKLKGIIADLKTRFRDEAKLVRAEVYKSLSPAELALLKQEHKRLDEEEQAAARKREQDRIEEQERKAREKKRKAEEEEKNMRLNKVYKKNQQEWMAFLESAPPVTEAVIKEMNSLADKGGKAQATKLAKLMEKHKFLERELNGLPPPSVRDIWLQIARMPEAEGKDLQGAKEGIQRFKSMLRNVDEPRTYRNQLRYFTDRLGNYCFWEFAYEDANAMSFDVLSNTWRGTKPYNPNENEFKWSAIITPEGRVLNIHALGAVGKYGTEEEDEYYHEMAKDYYDLLEKIGSPRPDNEVAAILPYMLERHSKYGSGASSLWAKEGFMKWAFGNSLSFE